MSGDGVPGWVNNAAGVIAAAVAVVVRATLADHPRAWKVVLLDAISTAGLAWAAFHLLLGWPTQMGGPLNEQFAFGAAVFLAVLGWAGIVRFAWQRWSSGKPLEPPKS
jgi:hypothetical protein